MLWSSFRSIHYSFVIYANMKWISWKYFPKKEIDELKRLSMTTTGEKLHNYFLCSSRMLEMGIYDTSGFYNLRGVIGRREKSIIGAEMNFPQFSLVCMFRLKRDEIIIEHECLFVWWTGHLVTLWYILFTIPHPPLWCTICFHSFVTTGHVEPNMFGNAAEKSFNCRHLKVRTKWEQERASKLDFLYASQLCCF